MGDFLTNEIVGGMSYLEALRLLVILGGLVIHFRTLHFLRGDDGISKRESVRIASRRDKGNQVGLIVVQMMLLIQTIIAAYNSSSSATVLTYTSSLTFVLASLTLTYLTIRGRRLRRAVAQARIREGTSHAID